MRKNIYCEFAWIIYLNIQYLILVKFMGFFFYYYILHLNNPGGVPEFSCLILYHIPNKSPFTTSISEMSIYYGLCHHLLHNQGASLWNACGTPYLQLLH